MLLKERVLFSLKIHFHIQEVSHNLSTWFKFTKEEGHVMTLEYYYCSCSFLTKRWCTWIDFLASARLFFSVPVSEKVSSRIWEVILEFRPHFLLKSFSPSPWTAALTPPSPCRGLTQSGFPTLHQEWLISSVHKNCFEVWPRHDGAN